MVPNTNATPKVLKDLHENRVAFKTEMLKAIACKTDAQKVALAKEWREKYNTIFYRELIAMAKDHKNRLKVAYWDLPNFDEKRVGKTI